MESLASRRARGLEAPPLPASLGIADRALASLPPGERERWAALWQHVEERAVHTVALSAHQAPPLQARTFDVMGGVVLDRTGTSSASTEATQLRLGLVGLGSERLNSGNAGAADFIQGGAVPTDGFAVAFGPPIAVVAARSIPAMHAALVLWAGWEGTSLGAYRDVDIRLAVEQEVIGDWDDITLPRGSASNPTQMFGLVFPYSQDRIISIRAQNNSARYPYGIIGRFGGYYWPVESSEDNLAALNRKRRD